MKAAPSLFLEPFSQRRIQNKYSSISHSIPRSRRRVEGFFWDSGKVGKGDSLPKTRKNSSFLACSIEVCSDPKSPFSFFPTFFWRMIYVICVWVAGDLEFISYITLHSQTVSFFTWTLGMNEFRRDFIEMRVWKSGVRRWDKHGIPSTKSIDIRLTLALPIIKSAGISSTLFSWLSGGFFLCKEAWNRISSLSAWMKVERSESEVKGNDTNKVLTFRDICLLPFPSLTFHQPCSGLLISAFLKQSTVSYYFPASTE